jgi:hypothetical protein
MPTEYHTRQTRALTTKKNWYHGVEGLRAVTANTSTWTRIIEESVVPKRSKLPNRLWTEGGGLAEYDEGALGGISSDGVGAFGVGAFGVGAFGVGAFGVVASGVVAVGIVADGESGNVGRLVVESAMTERLRGGGGL